MSKPRPRLLVIPGPRKAAGAIAQSLRDRFDVVIPPAGRETEALREGGYDYVLTDPDTIAPTERDLINRAAGVFLDTIGEGVCLTDPDGELLWSNDQFRDLDEPTRVRVLSVCRRAAQRFEEQLSEHGDGATLGSERFDIASVDESRHFEVLVSPFVVAENDSSQSPTVRRVAAVVWDVTSSRRVEQKMDAIDRAGRELVRLDADMVRRMHVGQRLALLEEKIVKFAHDLLRFDHFTIRLLDERTGRLELVMASGLPPETLELDLHASREGNGISGYVVATGRSYLCPDVTKDRRYISGLSGARSSLTVPLRLHDKIIGAFNVEAEDPGAFTEEDRHFAEMFANHIALALHILDLLVMERCTTGETVTGTVQGELSEPLEDIVHEADWLREAAGGNDPVLRAHVDRIKADVEAIRQRVREAAKGPQTILGAERALRDLTVDPDMNGKRILVTDDEPRIRQLIREVLGVRGCVVDVCEDGTSAIERLEQSREGPQNRRYDLVISDIKMPDRNGYEVFAAARQVDSDLPVILMTGFGYDPHHSIVRASQEGLRCVLFKPFQAERLIEEVRRALREKAATS